MCGRYNLTKRIETIEKELDIELLERELFDGFVNLGPGGQGMVISSETPEQGTWMQFGITPSWAKKKMYVFNARAEGDHNKENARDYRGAKGIISKPMFRKPIRSQRCLVIADSFIEGPTKEKLSKPFLIFKNDFSVFTLGGIWDRWVDRSTGEILDSFAIITTAATKVTAAVEHHRAPLLIAEEDRKKWLHSDTELREITSLLHPFGPEDFNAYPISDAIKNPRNHDIQLLYPTGKTVFPLREEVLREELELLGMGETPARRRKKEEDDRTDKSN